MSEHRSARDRRYQRAVEKIFDNYDHGIIPASERDEQLQILDERWDDARRRRDNIG